MIIIKSYVLALNAGSSSLKYKMFEMPNEELKMGGVIERIGKEDAIFSLTTPELKIKKELSILNHEDAINLLLAELMENNIIESTSDIIGVGHRVVHGGEEYSNSVVIDAQVERTIEELSSLAPLHNPANLKVIQIMRDYLPSAKHVAVFDTAFHQSMDPVKYIYPIPYEYYEKHKIRKYGFHGTSHKYVSERAMEILENKNAKIITCHLGNGCSISAIKNGKCINTSLGFTPLAGLMMGTRSGDIDPSIISSLMALENKSIQEIMYTLNNESGILGVSGVSFDMRDIESAINEGNKRAILALDIFTEKVAETIASYAVSIGGIDAIVFTAGIGENDITARELILDKIAPVFGIEIDQTTNNSRGKEVKITTNSSRIPAYVIPTNEELVIARDTYHLINEFTVCI